MVLVLVFLGGARIAQGQDKPTVTIEATTTTEVEEGQTAGFMISRTGPTTSALTVALSFESDDTDILLRDLVDDPRLPATVDIPIGQASVEVQIQVAQNAIVDSPDGGITATVSPDAAYDVGSPSSATIDTTDDGDQRIAITAGTGVAVLYENIGTQVAVPDYKYSTTGTHRDSAPDTFYVTPITNSAPPLTATPSEDYVAFSRAHELAPAAWMLVNGVWEWRPGPVDSGVTIVDNDAPEPPETFEIRSAASLGQDTAGIFVDQSTDFSGLTHVVTIYDDEVLFVVDVTGSDSLSTVEGEVLELALTAESKWLHACRTSGTQNVIGDMELTVTVELQADTAVNSDDFAWQTPAVVSANTGTLTRSISFSDFASVEGDENGACRVHGTASAKIDTVEDTTFEEAEMLTVAFAAQDTSFDRHVEFAFGEPPMEDMLPTASLSAEITDDDEPTLSVDSVSAEEDTEDLVFTVTLSPPSTSAVSVDYATSDGTATAGTDYAAADGTLTFAANETTKTITVDIFADVLDEANETVTLTLSNAQNAPIGTAVGTGTITDDDDPPELAVGNASALEDSEDLEFTVTLSPAYPETVTVAYMTGDGTAIDGTDYTAADGTLTFAPNETTKTITVDVMSDMDDEPDETLVLTLSTPTVATISTATGTGTITDDDVPAITFEQYFVQAAEGAGNLIFTVKLDRVAHQEVTVDYVAATYDSGPNPATAGSDFTATSGQLSIMAGIVEGTITVPILDDSTPEQDESLQMTLSNPVNAAIESSDNTLTSYGDILDDDGAPRLFVGDASALESTGSVIFTVTLAPAATGQVTVDYTTADDTATAGTDYTAVTTAQTLTFAVGETSKTVTVPVQDDSDIEPNETFTLNLSSAVDASIGNHSATGKILDDDTPRLSVSDASAPENTGNVVFSVTLTPAATQRVTVVYVTADDTAGANPATAGDDYTPVARPRTLTFEVNDTSKMVTVPVQRDSDIEPDETFLLELSGAVGAIIADGTATGTITNDDTPRLSVSDASAPESEGSLVFTVTLDPPVDQQITVDYTTADDTTGANPATAGDDYTAVTTAQTLTFTPNVTEQTITVVVQNDSSVEPDETFLLELSGAVGAIIADGTATGTITNDDRRTVPPVRRPVVTGGTTGGTTTVTPPVAAPRIGAILQDRVLVLDDSPVVLDLVAGLVGDVKTYRAVSDNKAVATTQISGSKLTLTPVALGVATVSVSGSNEQGSAFQAFRVTVVRSGTPGIARIVRGRVLTVGAAPAVVDLAPVFSGTIQSYQATSADPSLVRVRISGSRVSITGVAPGITTVTVTAKGASGVALQSFAVRAVEAGAPKVVRFLRSRTLTVGDRPLTVDASTTFSGNDLRYTAIAGDPGVVRIEVSGDRLVLTARAAGVTTVSFIAQNSQGAAFQSFRVTVQGAGTAGGTAGPAQEIPTN